MADASPTRAGAGSGDHPREGRGARARPPRRAKGITMVAFASLATIALQPRANGRGQGDPVPVTSPPADCGCGSHV